VLHHLCLIKIKKEEMIKDLICANFPKYLLTVILTAIQIDSDDFDRLQIVDMSLK
jgi:hypothetical protein